MNELQVETVKIIPAEIEFNFEEIEKELNESLKKFKSLTFTDSATTEIRKVLSDLRKGREAVERYRIDTKKELNEPVVKFEDKCKKLSGKFDDVINPLNNQLQDYVQRERDDKRELCEGIRETLIIEHELDDEHSAKVDIQDSYLTKSASIKQVEESMEFQVKNLKLKQNQKAANIEIVKSTVNLENIKFELSLSVDAYVRLLEVDDVEKVKAQIESDAQKEVESRKKIERAKQEQAEREKQAELERVEREEKERIEAEEKAELKKAQEVVEVIEPVVFNQKPIKEVDPITIDDLPFADIEETKNEVYSIEATEEQHKLVQQFLDENNIDYSIEMRLPF